MDIKICLALLLLQLIIADKSLGDKFRVNRHFRGPGQKLQDVIGNAPVFEEYKNDKHVRGRLVDIIRSEMETPMGVMGRATFKVLLFGKGPRIITHKPVLLDGMRFPMTSEVDSELDLVRLVSNRHTIAGIDTGTLAHRQLLHRLLDPTGELGLNKAAKGPLNIQGAIEEGSITRYALYGPMPQQELMRMMMRKPWAASAEQSTHFAANGLRLYTASFASVLAGIARSRKYPAIFEGDFREKAVGVYGALAALATIEADAAPPKLQNLARRLARLGEDALEQLSYNLEPHKPEEVKMREAEMIAAARGRKSRYKPIPQDPLLPINNEDRFLASCDILQAEPMILYQRSFDPQRMGRPHFSSTRYPTTVGNVGRLVANLLTGSTAWKMYEEEQLMWDYQPTVAARAAARKTLLHLLSLSWQGENQQAIEDGKTIVRYTLYLHLGVEEPDMRNFALEVLQAAGWGHPREIVPLCDSTFSRLMSAFSTLRRKGEREEAVRTAREVTLPAAFKLLAQVAKVQPRDGGRRKHSAQHVQNKVAEIYKKRQDAIKDGNKDTIWHDFVTEWEKYQKQ